MQLYPTPSLDFATAREASPPARASNALRRILETERDRWVLFLPVAMGSGVALYYALPTEPGRLWPLLLAVGFGLLALLLRRSGPARAAALVALCTTLGLLSASEATRRALPLEALPKRAVVLDGQVRRIERLPQGALRLTLSRVSFQDGTVLEREVRVRLRADDPAVGIADGDRVELRALLRAPSAPSWPGAPDARRDAFYSGLAGSGFALGPAIVTTDPTAARPGGLDALRDRIAARLEADLPGPRGAIAATLLVGAGAAIPASDRSAFAGSGLAHLLAVAGLHIGIVMGLAMGAVRLGIAAWPWAALRLPGREIAAVAALAAGGLYLAMTGAHLPIVRAFCMAALATLAILLGRRAISMRGLAIAATAILAVWPQELLGVSFQMSFSAVAALIAGYEVARPVFARLSNGRWTRRFALHVAALALTSLLAGVASMPFAAARFGEVQLYFILANLVAVPLTATLVMPAGLAALALMPFGLEQVALAPMGAGISVLLFLARTVTALPAATVAVPVVPPWGLAATALGIAVLCLLRTRVRLAGLVAIAIGLVSPAFVVSPDLVVSPDARLVGLRDGRSLRIDKRSGASRYDIEALARLWPATGDPQLLPKAGAAGPVLCDAAACHFVRQGVEVLLLRDRARPPACGTAGLVIAPFPLFDACAGRAVVDRFTVWREGAVAVRLIGGSVRLRSDADVAGDRPWTRRPSPAERSSLPPAATE